MLAALALSALIAAAATPAPRPGEPVSEQVHDNALVGEFVAPPDVARHPAVIVLGGFDGGVPTEAYGLARQGYAAFSVAYFNAPPLPKEADQVPVERVSRAIDYLLARPEVDPARIGILGVSHGGALALLAAARDQRIKSVAVVSGTAWVWFAPVFSGGQGSSWEQNGAPLPYIRADDGGLRMLQHAYETNGTYAFRDLYDASFAAASRDAIARATIPVERIAGPILCVAGDEDLQWDSAGACKAIAAERSAAHRDARDQVAIEHNAGHQLGLGGRAMPDVIPAGKMKFRLGGNLEANTRAGADAWTRTLTFFARTL
jgi:dienelactone hydrolase